MKIKAIIVTCQHTTKYGTDTYVRLQKKNECLENIIETIKAECDYDENGEQEYLDCDTAEVIIDTDDFEII